jgi:glutaminase
MLWRARSTKDNGSEQPADTNLTPTPSPADLRKIFDPAPASTVPALAASAPGVPLTSPIEAWLKELHQKYLGAFDGSLANYIPELTKANPAHFGIALATADGRVYEVGDSQALFTIQSISKPLVYGLALEDRGPEEVLKRVGVEPTGEAFNSIVMDEANNRPFNPMVNAGAIATTSLIKGNGTEERFGRILGMFEKYAGRKLTVDESVFQSERATGHKNRAIAYLELNSGMIEEPVSEHLDLYFRQCAILVSARDLAMMAATLANSGINPLTGEQAIPTKHVKTVLSVMASCGMYDYSGEWVYRVGLPAKSGVGGGIIAVLPGQFGLGTFSPLLDAHGNSHRGIEVCRDLSQRFQLHVYDTQFVADNIVRRRYFGGAVTSKRERPARERKVLDTAGKRILAYELQGGLYFATVEQLLRRMVEDAPEASFIILDCHRIGRADRSALTLLRDMSRSLAGSGKQLILAGLTERIKADWLALQDPGGEAGCWSANVDEALERCENRLIAEAAPAGQEGEGVLPLGAMDILSGLSSEQIARLAPYVTCSEYSAGSRIITEGATADRLFMLAAGSAAVSIGLNDSKRSARRAAFGPGVSFGEFALFDGARRVADVIAETHATCYELKFEDLSRLKDTDAALYGQILYSLGRLLADRQRRLTNELRSLA